MRETIGPERHAALMRVVEDSPGHSAASLRVPPLPDDAMDALINAMGTPEDHDRRMAAWRDAERDAMARVLGRGRGGDWRGGAAAGAGYGDDGSYVSANQNDIGRIHSGMDVAPCISTTCPGCSIHPKKNTVDFQVC